MQRTISRTEAGVAALAVLLLLATGGSLVAQEFAGREKLRAHSNEFRKDVIKVTDGVYVAGGYSDANSVLIQGDGASIIVDTTADVADAGAVKAEFAKLNAAPVRAIIYTQDRGKLLYRVNCVNCHQADRKGKAPEVGSIADIGVRLTPNQITSVIQHGQRAMPAFAKLSADEVYNLVAYLLNPHRAANADSPREPGPSTRYFSGFNFMIASNGLSPIGPPWSSLTAYDLNVGTILWRMPLGDVPELTARGIHDTGSHYPKVGPVVTAGGLIFTGTRDKHVRAIDSRDGKVLWEAELGSALEGIPAVYEVGGRQFIVFCAAAQAGITPATQAPVKGAYVAFVLTQ